MSCAAVFFDRDDTLIEDPGFLSDPAGVQLAPGAAEAVCRLRRAGFRIVVVTNQSGIARGLFDEPTLAAIHDRMRALFAEQDAAIDAIYYCPYLAGPEAVVERYRQESDLRKPRPGMYTLAAREHDIDLAASWSIGDSARDTKAGRAAGCRTIQLVRGDGDTKGGKPDLACRTLAEATEYILNQSKPEMRSPSPRPSPLAGEGERGTRACGPTETRAQASGPEAQSPSPRPSPLKGEGEGPASRSDRLLEEIAEHIRVWQRQRAMEDFTLAKLAGAVTEIVALGVAFWALMAMASPQPDIFPAHRWLAAIFLQLLALTFFTLHRHR